MHKALLEGMVFSLAGLGLGVAIWQLTGEIWVALPASAFGVGLPLCWLRLREGARHQQADELADRLAAEQGQHEATQQFIQRLLDVVPMPIYVKDAASRVIIVNRAQAEQWGQASGATMIGTPSFDLAPDPERTRLTREEDMAVLAGAQIYKEEHTLHDYHDQEQFRVITKGRCLDTQGGYVIVCARFDTTQWRQAEREVQQALAREKLLRQRNQDFIQRVIDVFPDPFYIKDQAGNFVLVNEAFARERGRTRESLIGTKSTDIIINPELAAETAPEDEEVLRGASIDKEQHYIDAQTGEERFRQISKHPCIDIDGAPVIVVAHINITRWKVAERLVARLANEDELTGLPNRRHGIAVAERMISSAARHDSPLSLLMFDLDHFKQVNDAHGHVIGDLVLKEVAQRLQAQLRAEDLPCRWGGEEFLVLLPLTDAAQAMSIAERLRECIAMPALQLDGLTLAITISGGVGQKLAGESLNDFIARTDKALYAAKHAGRNCCILA